MRLRANLRALFALTCVLWLLAVSTAADPGPQSPLDISAKALRIRIEMWCSCNSYSPREEALYALDIAGDGSLTFDGLDGKGALVAGKHRATTPISAVRSVLSAIASSPNPLPILRNKNAYRPVFIHGRITVLDGEEPALVHFFDYDGPPAIVGKRHPLIDAIDGLIDIERWVSGNDATVPALGAEGWDFKRIDDENMKVIAGVARNGTARGMLELVSLGAPISIAEQTKRKASTKTNILGVVGASGDDTAVDALLATGIAWSKRELSDAMVGLTAAGKLATVKRLLALGAEPLAQYGMTGIPADKRSANLMRLYALRIDPHGYYGLNGLMAAAKSGSPELVALMLRYDRRMKQSHGTYTLIQLAEGIGRHQPDAPTIDRLRSAELLRNAGAR